LERPKQRAVGTDVVQKQKGRNRLPTLSRHYRQIGIKAVYEAMTRKKRIVQRRISMSEARTTRAARETVDNSIAAGAETVRDVQEGFTSAVKNVRDLNLRLIDMAEANTQAAFEFAREVAEAKGPSELVQAWTTNATKQFDMLTKQAGELTRLGQSFARSMPELKGR
jgi:hypothetical protein